MAWTIPSDRLTGDVITAAQWNTFLGTSGDMSMTAAAKVTTAGDITYATAANTLARLGIGSAAQVLTVSGGIPAWATAATSDVVLIGSSSAATATTSLSAVDLVTISGLSILVTQNFRVEGNMRKTATAANSVALGWKANATVVNEAANSGTALCLSSATNRAEDGFFAIGVQPRSSANYLNGVYSMTGWYISATAGVAVAPKINDGGNTAPMPNATITSIAMRAINLTANNNVEITSIRILTGIT